MAMLKKTLFAAVACGALAFAASAFGQAGGAGGGGAGAGGSAGVGTTGTSGTGIGTGATSIGTANGSVTGTNGPGNGNTTLGTNNSLMNNGGGTNGTLGSNVAGTTGTGANTAIGGNGVGVNNTQTGNRLPLGGSNNAVANNLGTQGPAGTTSVPSALATNPGGTGVNGAAANSVSSSRTAGGIVPAAGGNGAGATHHAQTADTTPHHLVRRFTVNNANHQVTRVRQAKSLSNRVYAGETRAGSHESFMGLRLGHTATPIHGLSPRAIARLNMRERRITGELNRAELHHVTATELGPNTGSTG